MTKNSIFPWMRGFGRKRVGKVLATVLAGCFLASLAATATAQWPPHPTPEAPRTADGQVDMDGAVVRLSNGKPDFSGVWSFVRHGQRGDQGRPIGEPVQPPPGEPPYATFWELGFGLADGLPYQPWARELKAQRMADESKDHPDAYCLPLGIVQFHTHLQPRQVVHHPDVIVIHYEASAGTRLIYTDGRPLPDRNRLMWWYGYSVGHWDGDELVVESTHFRDGGWLDYNGSPLTDEARVIERFRRPDFGTLEIDITVDDPGAYTEPFTVRVDHRLMPDDNLIEWVCENEQSTQYFDP